MANDKDKKPEAPAAVPAPAPTISELDAAKAELAALKRTHELKLVQEEIEKLKNGGLSPAAVKRRDAALAKREATVKETLPSGKVLAVYELTEKSYKPLKPGGEPTLLEPGTVIRIPLEKLPGESMVAVKPAGAKSEAKFERA